jgi:hypothetical protein
MNHYNGPTNTLNLGYIWYDQTNVKDKKDNWSRKCLMNKYKTQPVVVKVDWHNTNFPEGD